MTLKKCWRCKFSKRLADFYKNRVCADGHEQLCKSCRTELDKARRARRKLDGICHCGKPLDGGYATCESCRTKCLRWGADNRHQKNENGRLFRDKLKHTAIMHYGGYQCACLGGCDVIEDDFLTIDHIHGGGSAERRAGRCADIYAWLKRHKYPEGFRVLCFNCNCGRARRGGICPHERSKHTLQLECDQAAQSPAVN